MQEIKRLIVGIALIIFVLAGGLTLLVTASEYLLKASLWLVYVDNAETGLPFVAEIIIKAIVESLVVGLCSIAFIKIDNDIAKAISIPVGFLVCIGIYAICKYIVWILIGLLFITAGIITIMVFKKKKESNV